MRKCNLFFISYEIETVINGFTEFYTCEKYKMKKSRLII